MYVLQRSEILVIKYSHGRLKKRFWLNVNYCSYLAKYWSEDNGGNEDGAEDDPGLGDGDSLGQGLGGVEWSDEGKGDPRDEDRPADQHQVDHSLSSHHRY